MTAITAKELFESKADNDSSPGSLERAQHCSQKVALVVVPLAVQLDVQPPSDSTGCIFLRLSACASLSSQPRGAAGIPPSSPDWPGVPRRKILHSVGLQFVEVQLKHVRTDGTKCLSITMSMLCVRITYFSQSDKGDLPLSRPINACFLPEHTFCQ